MGIKKGERKTGWKREKKFANKEIEVKNEWKPGERQRERESKI